MVKIMVDNKSIIGPGTYELPQNSPNKKGVQ
jgi:hypothetical protein